MTDSEEEERGLCRTLIAVFVLLCSMTVVAVRAQSGPTPETVARAMASYTPVYADCEGRKATGSGVFITPTVLVTAKHLSEPGANCTFSSTPQGYGNLTATYVSRSYDLMLLRSDVSRAFVAPRAQPILYEPVVLIGTPYGVTGFAVFGHVTRWGDPSRSVAFSDAQAAPGYSGGGVFNARGELVGVIVAGWTDTGYTIFLSAQLLEGFPRE